MLFSKKLKYITILIIFLILVLLTFFALGQDSRRTIISRVLVLHNIYRIQSLTHGLQVRDFTIVSKKLNDYIEFSKKFSEGRTYMFPGIYEATELSVARALTQSDYNELENIFEKLLEFDDRIYKLHVWYARAVSDENIEKAFKHIDTAIEISPSQDNAYRLALLLAQKSNDKNLANSYCIKYNEAFLGGHMPKHFPTLFDSYNNQRFSIKANQFDSKESLNFINSSFVINSEKKYEFILRSPLNLNGFNMYFSPLNNLILKFKEIEYFINGETRILDPKNLSLTSNHSFIIDKEDGSFEILITKMKDEVLRLRHDNLNLVEKINISMQLKKMNFVNSNLCKINK